MSRGPGGGRTRDIASARRRGSRRTAEARLRQEQRRRQRAAEQKHARRFLRMAAGIARRHARSFGGDVQVELTGGAGGLRRRTTWTEATVSLAPVEVSVRFTVAGKSGSGASTAIKVYAGRTLVRPCPVDVLQSGDKRAFGTWLSDALELAGERSRARS